MEIRKFDVVIFKDDVDLKAMFGEHIQDIKGRPCIIISNDANNKYCKNVNFVPMTTRLNKVLPCHGKISNYTKDSFAICEQIFTIDKKYIKRAKGHIEDKTDQMEIKRALTIQLIA